MYTHIYTHTYKILDNFTKLFPSGCHFSAFQLVVNMTFNIHFFLRSE